MMILVVIFLIFIFIILTWKLISFDSVTKGEAPEPKGAWPIVGHVPLLFGKAPAYRIVGGIADRHGPLIKLRLGALNMVVVSSAELAKECFTTSDRALQSRPLSPSGRILCFDYASFGLSPASPTWRLTRKIAVHDLLSTSRLNSLHHVWVSEVDMFVKELRGLCSGHDASEVAPAPVDFKAMLWGFCSNVTTRLVVGKRFFVQGGVDSKEGLRFKKLATELIRLVGVPIVADSFPFLKFLDWKYEWDLRNAFAEVESVMQGWLEEHEQAGAGGEKLTNLMEVLISLRKEGQLDNPDHSVNHIVKATAFMMIIASLEPTFLELVWVLSLLVNNPRVFNKAREELDSIVGEDRVVERSDIHQLKYLQAIVKETLRLYPVAPFLVPHEAIEHCKIGTAHVPAGQG